MVHRRIIGFVLAAFTALAASAMLSAGGSDVRIVNAAMNGDREAVRMLIKEAADVNAAQGDGITALHAAALRGDAEIVQMLLYAGANIRATTRIGAYTPVFMAAKRGSASVVDLLIKAGANINAKAADGLTPLALAAMSGNADCVRLLLEKGAEPNARETEHGQTPLILAAATDRADVIRELAKHGANLNLATEIQEPIVRPTFEAMNGMADPPPQAQNGGQRGQGNRGQRPPQAQQAQQNAADRERNPKSPMGGLTPLMYAARDGNLNALQALVESGADLNVRSGDKSTAVLIASINGRFDAAKYLVEHGADVNLMSIDGVGPLYGLLHVQWSRESERPQPSVKHEETLYLDLMTLMLDHGADPNAKLSRMLWYTSYGVARDGASDIGTTPFWKCASVADLDGMKLLLSRGADPSLANKDGVTPLLAASGAGTHGNEDIEAPPGRLAVVKYLVDTLQADVNASDNGNALRGADQAGQAQQQVQNPFIAPGPAGYTALHNAAGRGDNEMIMYLISKGANVNAVTKGGVTVVDMANGPRQRVQPYASTLALLEMLGATNSHKCVSC